jgi:hypothetical protein
MSLTRSQIVEKVRSELRLHTNKFITPTEIQGYIDSALEDGESIINDAGCMYFRTYKVYSVSADDSYISLPTDIYQARLLKLMYDENPGSTNQGESYQVKLISIENIRHVDDQDTYRYLLTNDSTNGLQLNIYPNIRETSTDRFTLYYLRKAKRLASDTDVSDFPKMEYIISRVKLEALSNLPPTPKFDLEAKKFARLEEQLRVFAMTLTFDTDETLIKASEDTLRDYEEFNSEYLG